jgi:transposase
MNDDKPKQPIEPPEQSPPQNPGALTASTIPHQDRREIVRLYTRGYPIRKIAKVIPRDRKTVRRVLREQGLLGKIRPPRPGPPSKLDPFREEIQKKVLKRLPASRILREIRAQGYMGGRTILADYIRSIQAALSPPRRAKRRFETGPAKEMQADWSTYRIVIAGVLQTVHALVCVLAYSRKAHVRFYRNERQSTLLEGLLRAFHAFGGVAWRVIFDNMAVVVLGRIGRNRKPIWHPTFLAFAHHYGFEAFLCRVRDPDRKGKTERFLDFLEKDFVRGSEFSSFDELNERVAAWTDTIANRRVHGTTRLVPDEAWLEERDFLIRLPEAPFPVHREEVRRVGPDATVSVAGTPYVIPERLADQSVAVRAYAEHFEIVDRGGNTAFSGRYKDGPDKGKLQLPPAGARPWIEASPERAGRCMDDELLRRFPDLAPMLEGLKLRMKSLWHIHVRALLRLAALYGDDGFLQAAKLAQQHHRFNAEAVRRILERDYPIPPCEPPIPPVGADARALYQLTETDPASFEPYQYLDSAEPTPTDPVNLEPAPANEYDLADPQSPEDTHDP